MSASFQCTYRRCKYVTPKCVTEDAAIAILQMHRQDNHAQQLAEEDAALHTLSQLEKAVAAELDKVKDSDVQDEIKWHHDVQHNLQRGIAELKEEMVKIKEEKELGAEVNAVANRSVCPCKLCTIRKPIFQRLYFLCMHTSHNFVSPQILAWYSSETSEAYL